MLSRSFKCRHFAWRILYVTEEAQFSYAVDDGVHRKALSTLQYLFYCLYTFCSYINIQYICLLYDEDKNKISLKKFMLTFEKYSKLQSAEPLHYLMASKLSTQIENTWKH